MPIAYIKCPLTSFEKPQKVRNPFFPFKFWRLVVRNGRKAFSLLRWGKSLWLELSLWKKNYLRFIHFSLDPHYKNTTQGNLSETTRKFASLELWKKINLDIWCSIHFSLEAPHNNKETFLCVETTQKFLPRSRFGWKSICFSSAVHKVVWFYHKTSSYLSN